MAHTPIEITHLGSAICSYMRLTGTAIFQVRVPANNHEVGLAGSGAKYFGAEACDIVTRHGRTNHFERAARKPKSERPDGVSPTPV